MRLKYSTRLVILTKNRAYKIPLSYRGYLQGKNERKVWNEYRHTNLLVPLLYERYGVVIQERVEPVQSIDNTIVRVIKMIIPQFQFDNCDLHNKDNWGLYKGQLRLIDYGIDEKISKMY